MRKFMFILPADENHHGRKIKAKFLGIGYGDTADEAYDCMIDVLESSNPGNTTEVGVTGDKTIEILSYDMDSEEKLKVKRKLLC